jgi:hypothetical protein
MREEGRGLSNRTAPEGFPLELCPVCCPPFLSRHCKMLCPRCGFFMSCSEFE